MHFYRLLKKWVKILVKGKLISIRLSGTCNQKPLDHAKQSSTDAVKTSSKRVIQKTAEATDNSIGNKSANKITKVSKNS